MEYSWIELFYCPNLDLELEGYMYTNNTHKKIIIACDIVQNYYQQEISGIHMEIIIKFIIKFY